MALYDKPVWQLMHTMAIEFNLDDGDIFVKDDVIRWFAKYYPLIKVSTITAHLTKMSINSSSRPHYNAKPGTDDLFFKIDSNTYRLYDPERDPSPIYGLSEESTSRKKNPIAPQYINKFNIKDEQLRKRMDLLGSAPSDTIIREAGVILESRLRDVGRVKEPLVGAKLVDHIFEPPDGILVFSSHSGEQDGVRMLYRGAMQFIRNPPMHKLMDYSDEATHIFLTLIDTLLILLTELNPQHRDDVSVDQIRSMLKLGEISDDQISLYRLFLNSSSEWKSVAEISLNLNITRRQVSGLLGSLGKRLNRTPGLEDKGSLLIILDRKKENQETFYRMRQILKDALGLEKIR